VEPDEVVANRASHVRVPLQRQALVRGHDFAARRAGLEAHHLVECAVPVGAAGETATVHRTVRRELKAATEPGCRRGLRQWRRGDHRV
jgi:hypothetical protein